MRIDWNNLAPIRSIDPITPRQATGAEEAERAAPVAALSIPSGPTLSNADLTPDTLRAALLDLGIAADPESMELAEAFVRLGLPLTDDNLIEGRAVLARFPKIPAAAYAMAKILDAPLSSGVLRALSRVLEGALATKPLPDDILGELSLALQGRDDPKQLAKELYHIIARLGRSTEQRIADDDGFPEGVNRSQIVRSDPRAQLLTLLSMDDTLDRPTRTAADAHAAHIEGQQLLNQIALKRFDPPVPLYFAFPYRVADGSMVTAEVQVWTRDEDNEDKNGRDSDYDDGRLVLQTTIRLSPPKIGLMEIRLSGRQDAVLDCTVLVERPASYRLLRRHTSDLASGLSKAGWHIDDVSVGMAQEFAPLWFGGAALNHPRGRVDHKV